MPKYKHKTKGRNIVVYPIDAINSEMLKKGKVKLSMSNISIDCRQKNIKQVRIIPRYANYRLEIVYEKSRFLFDENDVKIKFIRELRLYTAVSLHLLEKFSTSLQKQIQYYKKGKKSKKLKKMIADKLNSFAKNFNL